LRRIIKRAPPARLTEWRRPRLATNKPDGMDCTYGELRRDAAVIVAVEDALFAEQGGICAYTGHRLTLSEQPRTVGFHCEHLKSQQRCRALDGADYGEDTDYRNLVACWPPANFGSSLRWGAHRKGAWPESAEQHLFVSPLSNGCQARFRFARSGQIEPANADDHAAAATIHNLGLDHDELTELRRSTIKGFLRQPLSEAQAKPLLAQLQRDAARVDAGERLRLTPFCFAIEQALQREIRALRGSMESRRRQEGGRQHRR